MQDTSSSLEVASLKDNKGDHLGYIFLLGENSVKSKEAK
jgi:hypothetical protein